MTKEEIYALDDVTLARLVTSGFDPFKEPEKLLRMILPCRISIKELNDGFECVIGTMEGDVSCYGTKVTGRPFDWYMKSHTLGTKEYSENFREIYSYESFIRAILRTLVMAGVKA